MTKTDANKLFGNASRLAEALGVSHQAVSKWPEKLPQRRQDEINGAAFRLGLLKSIGEFELYEVRRVWNVKSATPGDSPPPPADIAGVNVSARLFIQYCRYA